MRSVITTLLLAFVASGFSNTILSNDSVKVVIKLKSINDVLTFNQPHVAPGSLEYAWELRINSDNNIATGDNEGYDVGMVLENTKYGTSLSYTGTIISGTDQHTWIYNGSSRAYGNQLYSYFNFVDSTITLIGMQSWPELANVNTGDKISVRTFYNSATGIQNDSINPVALCAGALNDNAGDVASPFIDLIKIKVELPITVGSTEQISNENKLVIFPNPGPGLFYINHHCRQIEVYDIAGNKLQSLENRDQIDLRHAPKGTYLLRILNGSNYVSTKVTVY